MKIDTFDDGDQIMAEFMFNEDNSHGDQDDTYQKFNIEHSITKLEERDASSQLEIRVYQNTETVSLDKNKNSNSEEEGKYYEESTKEDTDSVKNKKSSAKIEKYPSCDNCKEINQEPGKTNTLRKDCVCKFTLRILRNFMMMYVKICCEGEELKDIQKVETKLKPYLKSLPELKFTEEIFESIYPLLIHFVFGKKNRLSEKKILDLNFLDSDEKNNAIKEIKDFFNKMNNNSIPVRKELRKHPLIYAAKQLIQTSPAKEEFLKMIKKKQNHNFRNCECYIEAVDIELESIDMNKDPVG